MRSVLAACLLGLSGSTVGPFAQTMPGTCAAGSDLIADSGPVTGAWTDPGVVNDIEYDCGGSPCGFTGNIPSWPCADPTFVYEGPDTGYEYTYAFVAPGDGTCTFVERGEGIEQMGHLVGVVDWFLVDAGGGECGPSQCIEYIWENVQEPVCGDEPNAVCSHASFAVSTGETFFVVADIFAGLDSSNPEVFPFQDTWNVEITCDVAPMFSDGFEGGGG